MQCDSRSAAGTQKLNPGPSPGSDPTAAPSTDSGSTDLGPMAFRSWSRLARFVAALYRQTLVNPVEQGRLRDVMWPYGLRAIVLVGYVVFTIAALTVILSGPIRERSTLIVFGFGSGLGLPAQTVWPLVLLLSFGVAALMAAAQHGPWWLKLLGLLFTLIVGWLADHGGRLDGGASGACHRSVAAQFRLVGIRGDVGVDRPHDDDRSRRDPRS
jgi:hypothetical protein